MFSSSLRPSFSARMNQPRPSAYIESRASHSSAGEKDARVKGTESSVPGLGDVGGAGKDDEKGENDENGGNGENADAGGVDPEVNTNNGTRSASPALVGSIENDRSSGRCRSIEPRENGDAGKDDNTNIYRDIYVLMLGWQDEASGVWGDLERLATVFNYEYNFKVIQWPLLPMGAEDTLLSQLRALERTAFLQDSLLIVYYIGHGRLAHDESLVISGLDFIPAQAWHPHVNWTTIQHELQRMDNDVLIILDSCASAGVVARTDATISRGKVEIIAACGYDENARAPNCVEMFATFFEPTFTRAMIDSLAASAQANSPVTAASLQLGMVKTILTNVFRSGYKGFEVLPTAVHFTVGNDPAASSIPLQIMERPQRIAGQWNWGWPIPGPDDDPPAESSMIVAERLNPLLRGRGQHVPLIDVVRRAVGNVTIGPGRRKPKNISMVLYSDTKKGSLRSQGMQKARFNGVKRGDAYFPKLFTAIKPSLCQHYEELDASIGGDCENMEVLCDEDTHLLTSKVWDDAGRDYWVTERTCIWIEKLFPQAWPSILKRRSEIVNMKG
ncbi:hypothetical protein DL98DRAFT_620367 [Cadophora sp. DSE1049]|nr:hypothetical protein DL98DRAFT_620367 [Cadophora sp. DSE1049]